MESPKNNLTDLPEPDHHNVKVHNAIASLFKDRPSFAIVDKGRCADERSCIWVQEGDFYGMGYIASDIGFTEPSAVKDYVTPYRSNQYIMQLINAYAEKHPGKVILQQSSI
jgi:DNA polymerase III subunit epsilon